MSQFMAIATHCVSETKEASMSTTKSPMSRPYDDAVVDLLKADPQLANEYLAAAMDEATEPGGQVALLGALRHVAEVQGKTQCS